MSEVTLPTRPAAPPTHQAAGSSAPGTVSDPPTAALRLGPGSLLHGVVSGQNRQGQLLVQTNAGLLAVATKLALPPGREVSLQIRSAGSQLHITILPLESAPPASPPAGGRPAPSPLPSALPAPGGGGALGDPAVIREPPPAAARLPAGSLLAASVIDRDPDGGFILRSEIGQLRVSTNAALVRGDQLSLQVRSLQPDLQVTLLPRQAGADALGQRAGPAGGLLASGQGAAGGAGTPTPALGHATPTVDVLAVGRPIQALVLSAGTQAGATAGQSPTGAAGALLGAAKLGSGAAPTAAAGPTASLNPGTTLEVRIQQVTPPGQATVATAQAGPTLGASPTQPQQSLLTHLAGLAPARLAAALDIAAVGRSPATQPVLQGRVIGSAAGGQPILETPRGTLQLAVETALPKGTRLLLTLPDGMPQPGAETRAAGGSPAIEALARQWPALEALLPLLEDTELSAPTSQSATQPSGTSVPQPGPKLASSLLFFLNALTGGDPGAWLDGFGHGRLTARLEALGHQGLLARLRGDLGRMAAQADAAGVEWRFLPVPFFDGQSLQQLHFFFRHHGGRGDQGGGEDDKESTRFLLDVELTKLGALQFDGLIQPQRFDMILRSHSALPDWMQRDIRSIFENANEAAGAAGQLKFHPADDWAPLAAAATKPEPEGLVV